MNHWGAEPSIVTGTNGLLLEISNGRAGAAVAASSSRKGMSIGLLKERGLRGEGRAARPAWPDGTGPLNSAPTNAVLRAPGPIAHSRAAHPRTQTP
jgi:hypothetical protein